jgi:hypothetical protein
MLSSFSSSSNNVFELVHSSVFFVLDQRKVRLLKLYWTAPNYQEICWDIKITMVADYPHGEFWARVFVEPPEV